MTPEELLSKAIEFDAGNPVHLNGVVFDDDDDVDFHHHYKIVFRGGLDDKGNKTRKWAISDGTHTLSQNGEWEYESSPSNRSDGYLDLHRFPSVEAAFTYLNAWKVEERKRAIEVWKFTTWKQRHKVQPNGKRVGNNATN